MDELLSTIEFGSLGDWVAVIVALIALILFLLAEWTKLRQWFVIRAVVYSLFSTALVSFLFSVLLAGLGGLMFFVVGLVMQGYQEIGISPFGFFIIGGGLSIRIGSIIGGIIGLILGIRIAWEDDKSYSVSP